MSEGKSVKIVKDGNIIMRNIVGKNEIAYLDKLLVYLQIFSKNSPYDNPAAYDLKWKTLLPKEKLLVLSNFFFCHYVFKKKSHAEVSESVYMRERVK